ncbi:hypothetical protein BDZ89DRAFT_1037490 [Hymenopellis radicata]|nr:hypothetical protein BDZ89DRAFT_1037490 [Hymenopellis radicata]
MTESCMRDGLWHYSGSRDGRIQKYSLMAGRIFSRSPFPPPRSAGNEQMTIPRRPLRCPVTDVSGVGGALGVFRKRNGDGSKGQTHWMMKGFESVGSKLEEKRAPHPMSSISPHRTIVGKAHHVLFSTPFLATDENREKTNGKKGRRGRL